MTWTCAVNESAPSTLQVIDFGVNMPRHPPHAPQHLRHRRTHGHFGLNRHAYGIEGFGSLQQQAHHVVADRRDRQAFHRALQAQLHILPPREFLRQLLVLHFGRKVYPRAQQGAGARDSL